MEVEIADETDPEKKDAFEAAVKALADAMGIEVELESEESEEEPEKDSEAMPDMEADKDSGDEEAEGETEKEYELEETDTAETLSEDELVETVLSRVTARLVAEAKKKRMSIKEKMKLKKTAKKNKNNAEEEKEESPKKESPKKGKVAEATDAKGGGPLLSKGGNKHDTYKGHADMAYAKGKEGKGGHQMEVLPAKAEHSVTHGGKNLATLGGNKKKV